MQENEGKKHLKQAIRQRKSPPFGGAFSSAILSQNLDDTIDLYRFRQVGVHPGFHAFFRIFIEGIRRHGDDGDGFRIRSRKAANDPCRGHAVHDRHHDIHEDGIEGARDLIFEKIDSLFAIAHDSDARPLIGEEHLRDLVGDRDDEGRALPLLTGDRDGSTHRIDESLHDGHTEPRPLIYTAGILSFLGEGIENMSQKLRAHADTGIRSGPSIGVAIPARSQKLHLCQDAAALFSETRYLGDRSQDPFPCLRYSHGSPSSAEKKSPPCKRMVKKQSLSSPSLLFSHAKRPGLFVLTFEKLA